MTYCTKCGKKNDDDAEFCDKCGVSLDIKDKKDSIKKPTKKTEKKIEKKAEEFGKSIEKAGMRFESKIDNSIKNFQKWYDNKFKLFGPLIWSFLGLIILRLIISGMNRSGDDIVVFGEIGDLLYSYLLIFFCLMLMNFYNSYLNRIYKKQYRYIYPAISTISCIVTLWIISKILIILDTHLAVPFLSSIANFIDEYIFVIFIVILVLSYFIELFIKPLAKEMSHK
jgi:ribosomal protein L40E